MLSLSLGCHVRQCVCHVFIEARLSFQIEKKEMHFFFIFENRCMLKIWLNISKFSRESCQRCQVSIYCMSQISEFVSQNFETSTFLDGQSELWYWLWEFPPLFYLVEMGIRNILHVQLAQCALLHPYCATLLKWLFNILSSGRKIKNWYIRLWMLACGTEKAGSVAWIDRCVWTHGYSLSEQNYTTQD